VRRAAVLGSPIAHSLSPALHTAAYGALGLSGWTYEAIECDEAGLPGLLASLGPEWAGLSLTMPLKRAVLPLLDRADPLVTQVGGANTVLLSGAGRAGYNTDVPGLVAALGEAGVQVAGGELEPGAEPVLVLGGGATARSALAALRQVGARSAVAAVRDPAAAMPLLDAGRRMGIRTRLAESRLRPWRLVLSTVPAGAADGYADLVAASALTAASVFDVVYHPWPTPLARAAEAAGSTVVGGFSLLLHQAAEQVRLMTGRPAPVEAMRAAGLAALTAGPRS
jgi:shikimate dehydrogenase